MKRKEILNYLKNKLKHNEKKKERYWGKDHRLYLWYDAACVTIKDILIDVESDRDLAE